MQAWERRTHDSSFIGQNKFTSDGNTISFMKDTTGLGRYHYNIRKISQQLDYDYYQSYFIRIEFEQNLWPFS